MATVFSATVLSEGVPLTTTDDTALLLGFEPPRENERTLGSELYLAA